MDSDEERVFSGNGASNGMWVRLPVMKEGLHPFSEEFSLECGNQLFPNQQPQHCKIHVAALLCGLRAVFAGLEVMLLFWCWLSSSQLQ